MAGNESGNAAAATGRAASYDGIHVLRVLACFMVVMVHVSSGVFESFSPVWLASIVFNAWGHSCVPLFFMISGFLLLDRGEAAPTFYARRFARIIPPFLFYCLLYLYDKKTPLTQYARKILAGDVEFHLWYVYALIGVYAALPFLGKIFVRSGREERGIFLFLWFALNMVAAPLKRFLSLPYDVADLYDLYPFIGYGGYVFLGGCLKGVSVARPRLLLGLSLAASFLAFAGTYAYSRAMGRPEALFLDFFSIPVALAAVLLFAALKDVRVVRFAGALRAVSGATYGIYLVHILVLKYAHRHVLSVPSGSPWLTIPLLSAVCFLGSLLVVLALRRVRFLRPLAG